MATSKLLRTTCSPHIGVPCAVFAVVDRNSAASDDLVQETLMKACVVLDLPDAKGRRHLPRRSSLLADGFNSRSSARKRGPVEDVEVG